MKIGSCTQPNSIADSLPLCLSPRTLSSIYSKLGAQNPRQASTRPAPAENTFGHVCGARSKTFLRLTFLHFFLSCMYVRVCVCVCVANFTKSLTIFRDPEYVQGLGIAAAPIYHFTVSIPHPASPTVIRIEVSATWAATPPPAVGFGSWRCYFGKVNFLSVKREIDMAAGCFISWIETLQIVQVAFLFVFFFFGFVFSFFFSCCCCSLFSVGSVRVAWVDK